MEKRGRMNLPRHHAVPRRLPTLGGLGLIGLVLLVAGCTGMPRIPLPQTTTDLGDTVIRGTDRDAPPGADPASCWGRDFQPARIETITEQIRVRPARLGTDGQVLEPAIFRTETRQTILRDREPLLFPSPCPEVMDAEFLSSLQRALAVRGHYEGPVTGSLDAATRTAIRSFQSPQGLDSAVLSIAAARQLGLVDTDPGSL
jgi:hypothetical protein